MHDQVGEGLLTWASPRIGVSLGVVISGSWLCRTRPSAETELSESGASAGELLT